eukprot:Em0014g603a
MSSLEAASHTEPLPSGLKTVLSENGLDVRIYYLECLAQATYLITHEGNAMIVDPRRDVDAFIEDLKTLKCSLKGVMETHFHADFVSGHCELMQRTGAPIYFGPGSAGRAKFTHHELKDGEVIDFSSQYAFHVVHTPGHTPESVVYLLIDKTKENKPLKAFTGDTLFVGSCGRPDLVGSLGYTAEEMAKLMFYTLKTKICTLPDDVQVFPAHGKGSPCGKGISGDLYSTIGKEKLTNPALQFDNEAKFVRYLTEDQPVTPQYFLHDVKTNLEGASSVEEEIAKVQHASAKEFKSLLDEGTYVVIDTRDAYVHRRTVLDGQSLLGIAHQTFWLLMFPEHSVFPLGSAGGTIVGVQDGNFAIWVGTMVSPNAKLLVITAPGRELEALQRLTRIGYNQIKAVLDGGFSAYSSAGYPVCTEKRLNLKDGVKVSDLITNGDILLDMRTPGEYQTNSVKGAINLPITSVYKGLNSLDKSKTYVAFCAGGYRSGIASSILRAEGFKVVDIFGGFAAISTYEPAVTTTGVVCPTMKGRIELLEKALK